MEFFLLTVISSIILGFVSCQDLQSILSSQNFTRTPSEDDIFREFSISFDQCEASKLKLTQIFSTHGLDLTSSLRSPDPFEKYYPSSLDLKSYYPNCPVCQKAFKTREFLYLHMMRSHLVNDKDINEQGIIFSDACEFMKCSEQQEFAAELKPVNLHRCMKYIDDYFKFEKQDQIYELCKEIVTSENVNSSRDDITNQVFSWLFFIALAIVTLVYVIYIVDAHLTDDKSVLINLD